MDDLESLVITLRNAGAHFRNEIVTGVGGRQITLEDPSGNTIELFEPTIDGAHMPRNPQDDCRSEKIGKYYQLLTNLWQYGCIGNHLHSPR